MIYNNKYEVKEFLGNGGFGAVFKVLNKIDNNYYALKFIKNSENIEIKTFKKDNEKIINIINDLKNKYIIELKDNFYDEINKGYCIVMGLCDGNLRNILNKYKPNGLPLNIINKIFIQINDALKAMIKKGYTYRDLKPENILIKYTDQYNINFDIKLSDFGLSTYDINSSLHNFSTNDSLNYMAPEIETLN